MNTTIDLEDRAKARALHLRVRQDMHLVEGRAVPSLHALEQKRRRDKLTGPETWATHRYMLLAWAFLRGLPFRRIERDHQRQILPDGTVFEHNLPNSLALARILRLYLPEVADDFASPYSMKPGNRIDAWIMDPSGGIAPPPARAKSPPPARAPVAAE
jgi:hypothetical protein